MSNLDAGLDIAALVRRDAFTLDVRLTVSAGETVAIVGPNGAGKSTLLRTIAGLLTLDAGTISLRGELLDDVAGGTFVDARERRIGVVFQDYVLFPSMSARENVAFGLRAAGVSAGEARRRADAWLARLDVGERANAKPAELSGGQAQRVALARALAIGPRALLLDEPLSALDVSIRAAMRRDLRAMLDDFAGPRLIVTHDLLDAYALADRLVIIEDGRVTQEGSIGDVTARPRTAYAADLAGVNVLSGTLDRQHATVTTPTGATIHVTPTDARGDAVLVAIRPQAVALSLDHPHGSQRNVWAMEATTAESIPGTDRIRVGLGAVAAGAPESLVAEVTAATVAEFDLVPGRRVWAAVKATDVAAY